MPRNKSIKSIRRKSLRSKRKIGKQIKKTTRRNKNIRGGGWAPWEGSSPRPFASIHYNRYQGVPLLSEMGQVDTIY